MSTTMPIKMMLSIVLAGSADRSTQQKKDSKMGMFDYIRCEAPLPDGWRPKEPMQTKDFDCEMVCHVITADGRLMLERIDATHIVPKAERPYPNEPDDTLMGMCGMLRTDRSLHESNFHGVVNFYGNEYRNPDDTPTSPTGTCFGPDGVTEWETGRPLKRIWHEYNAKFTDGKLVEITIERE